MQIQTPRFINVELESESESDSEPDLQAEPRYNIVHYWQN